ARGSSERTIVHPTPGRPGHTVVHTTPARPGNTVVHHGPRGTTVAHTGVRPGAPVRPGPPVRPVVPGRPTVHHTAVRPVVHHVRYGHVYPYHGVFVYGPRPVTHVHYVHETGPVQVKRADLPKREIDRNESLAVGLKGGSLISGTESGPYSDPGLGLAARYRPAESVGLELALTHHGQTVDPLNSRSQTQVAGSVELFAYPWTRVSPYVLGGVTLNSASIADDVWTGESYTSTASKGGQLGLHGGLGLELALGKSVALDLEGRYIGWVTPSALEVQTAPGALQATAGLMVHFK
ncbi:MAG: outer membrane beta-barrel protein, partial [Myxococcota bacterium]